MPNTYTQIHLQIVFAVQNRQALLTNDIKERVHKYMASIIENNGHKVLAIGGTSNHVHILIGFRPNGSLSTLIQEVKRDSSSWINKNHITPYRFNWQEGYGAFSYSKSHVQNVISYILNQEEHHKKHTFKDEYIKMLQSSQIEYDERYLFDDV